MADKPDDVKDDQDEVLEALTDEKQDSSKAEPSPAKETKETKKPEVAEDKAQAESPEETEGKPDKAQPPAKADEAAESDKPEETEEQPLGKAEERKAQLNTEIRDLVAKRNALKTEVEKTNAEVYQPAAEDELTGQPKDPNDPESPVYTALEARVEAMRQQQEMDKYNTAVAEAQLTISHESEKVLDEFPIFNPDKPEFDEELATEAADLLRQNLIIDPNTNQVIGSNVSPYQLYKTIARAHQSSTLKGQMKGREDTEQMLANADTPGNAAPVKEKKDPVLDILSSDDY